MTVTSVLPVRVWKEFRGLSPAWLAAFASITVAALLDDRVRALGLVAYVLGTVSVGALSMGHEYNGRTLTLMLSQPVGRQRLILEKMSVLAVMLLALCGVAWLGLFDPSVQWGGSVSSARNRWVLVFALPLLCGLFVAPWLTMVCRNALAGLVFAVAVPATIWIASDIVSAVTYGGDLSTTVEARDFAFEMFWRGTVIVCAVAAAAGWWMFLRLEAIDSRGLEVSWPSRLLGRAHSEAAPTPARRLPVWLLVKKELRLQQLTIAVSGLYLVGCSVIWLFRDSFPVYQITLFSAVTILHAGAIVLLAGALPSAEERQLGTLEWQVLLPMPVWKQWAVKVGMALSVAIVLALGLPTVISLITSSADLSRELRAYHSPVRALAVVMGTIGSLYVSSLSANGLRALLVSLPAVFGVMGLGMRWVLGPVYGGFGISGRLNLVFGPMRFPSLYGTREIVLSVLLTVGMIAIYAGALALLLRFAMANHRSMERGATRVWKQLSWMTGSVVVGSLLWAALFVPYRAGITQRVEAANREWMATRATGEFVIEDLGDTAARDCVVIVFAKFLVRGAVQRPAIVIDADAGGRFARPFYDGGVDVQYSAIAVPKADVFARLGRERERLEQSAIPIHLPRGESTTINLKFTPLP